MAVYRSEVHIPVQKDSLSFQDRQIKQWSNVQEQSQQQQWQDQFDKMRQDFFVLKPSEKQVPAPSHFSTMDSLKSAFDVDSQGRQIFRVRFDVSEFKPEEISVKVQDNKLVVNARHQEKTAQSSVSREYSRQVDIPGGVDQDTLNCLLSKDGILTVEGPANPPPSLLARETYLPVHNTPTSPPVPISPSSSSSRPPQFMTGPGTPVKNPIITEPDGSRRMRLSVDIGEFSPEEIVVKTMDRKLIVHAEHEERSAGRTLHKEFNKEYDLPESVDSSAISAYLTEDRQLTIEAPLKPAQVQPRKMYEMRESQDVQRVVVNKEGSVTISDTRNRPVITISVHRK